MMKIKEIFVPNLFSELQRPVDIFLKIRHLWLKTVLQIVMCTININIVII